MGGSFSGTTNTNVVGFADGAFISSLDDGATVAVVVDASTGKLKWKTTGTPDCLLMYWIEFSAPIY
jgi:hypothetical protein